MEKNLLIYRQINNDNYSLALPRCEKNNKLLFCEWKDKQLTNDSQGILSPNPSLKLSYENISMIFDCSLL